MKTRHHRWMIWFIGGAWGFAVAAGCWHMPSAQTMSRNYDYGDAPIDSPSECEGSKFDDVVDGGQLFKYHCGMCHNARALGERPFSNYHVALAHMREQAYLTGKEYRQIVHFLRRWHDVGPPTPDVKPSPKRFIYAQPMSELRGEQPKTAPTAAPEPPKAKIEQGDSRSSNETEIIWRDPGSGPKAPTTP